MYQINQFILMIGPVAAPPITECKTGDDGDLTGQFLEINNAGSVIPAVAKKVQIFCFRMCQSGFEPTCFVENEGTAVVDDGPSRSGYQPGIQFLCPIYVIQSTNCPFEVGLII